MNAALLCAHCSRPIVEWSDPNAERLYGRSPLFVHESMVDGSSDSPNDGVYCTRDEVTFAEPVLVGQEAAR